MLDWLTRIFRRREDDERQGFIDMVDTLNREAAGGSPTIVERHLGDLRIRSGVLVLGDPQYLPSVEVPNIDTDMVSISAKLRQYPSGVAIVANLAISMAEDTCCEAPRKVGEVGIDSAVLVVADKADIDECWTEIGKDRIGVISTARSDALLRDLSRRFHLNAARINSIRAEVVGPVSEELEQEIEDYLRSIPEYAKYPFMHFYVQTNNSFDRANRMEKAWEFMPVGNNELPSMLVCSTGHGDGCYGVQCRFSGDTPRAVYVDFMEDDPCE